MVGQLVIDEIDDNGEIAIRKCRDSVRLDQLLSEDAKRKFSFEPLNINLDFDDQGRLLNLEFYV
ncbi:MAG: hypothetical protein ACI861_000656 [Paracoccaceae bacterium]